MGYLYEMHIPSMQQEVEKRSDSKSYHVHLQPSLRHVGKDTGVQ